MKEGVPIEQVDPQPIVRKGAETATDWEFKDEALYLYEKARIIRDRLIDPIARIDREELPDPVIGFKDMRNYKVLAEYLLVRDEIGLTSRINFNTEHYKIKGGKKEWKWGRWAQLETITHEYIHLKQHKIQGHASHGQEFVEECEKIGLHPLPGVGCHTAVADEPFAILMAEWGIERPEDVPFDKKKKISWFRADDKRKGRSSLNKWICPDCKLNVRIGIKADPQLIHEPCGSMLINADNLPQTLWINGEREPIINEESRASQGRSPR